VSIIPKVIYDQLNHDSMNPTFSISRKEETSTFKPKGTEKCNQVMVTIRPERNAMTPDKKPSAAENFSMKFSRRVKNATPVTTRSPVAPAN
jgi:hypothetical protein